jgi:hypothetical protein
MVAMILGVVRLPLRAPSKPEEQKAPFLALSGARLVLCHRPCLARGPSARLERSMLKEPDVTALQAQWMIRVSGPAPLGTLSLDLA